MLLTLAPGLRVVRRGRDHLQVGLYDDRRVVLPRTDATAHVLGRIEEGLPVDLELPGVPATVRQLVASGCALPQRAGQPVGGRARRRAESRLAVVGHLGPDTRSLLTAAGLGTLVRADEPADVGLLLARGEPERELVDPWLRSRLPHLVVRLVDAGAVVGPFVLPGRSPCLRCLDAHRAEADPDHLAVLARYGKASRRARPHGDDTEPALLSLALSWAVRDLVAHADGLRASTVSRTVRLGPGIDREVRTTWAMHPECGCCWPGTARG